jgi:uncharacterized glyoxalase superfamily protein PhnB
MPVKPVPDGYHTVTPYLLVKGVSALIDFLKEGFDAVEIHRTALPGGAVMHAEMQIGDSRVMMGEVPQGHSPMPAMLYLYVPDVDAVHAKAIRAGATLLNAPADMFYGDRAGAVKDLAGNSWWIATHKENVTAEQIAERAAKQAMKR